MGSGHVGGHPNRISREHREQILSLYLEAKFDAAQRLADSLGLKYDYAERLANARGYHLVDVIGRRKR